MTLQSIIQSLALVGIALQVCLAAVLLIKQAWGKFPLFVAYSLLNLSESVVLYMLMGHRQAYFYSHFVGEAIAVILGVAVVYEIFGYLFSLYPGLRRVALLNLYGAVVLLLVLAGTVLYTHTPIGKNGVVQALLLVEEAARIIEVGLVTLLFVFSTVFGLHWRQPVFGITLGVGIYAVIRLLMLVAAPHVGLTGPLALVNAIGFDCSMLIWLGYMLVPERVNQSELPARAQLEQWNQVIMELIHQ